MCLLRLMELLMLLACIGQAAPGTPEKLSIYLHDLEYTLENETIDDDDIYFNIASARERAASIIQYSTEDIDKYMEAFASQKLLRARPSCDHHDNILIMNLYAMKDELSKKEYQSERVKTIIEKTLRVHKAKCFEILTNQLRSLDATLSESNRKALVHFDNELGFAVRTKNGPMPPVDCITQGAYNMIKLHADDDKEVKLILPGIIKLLPPIQPIKNILKIDSRVIDELYQKYVVEPCLAFFVKTKHYSTAIRLEQKLYAKEFASFLKRYNSCKMIISQEEEFNKTILDRLYKLVAEKTGGAVQSNNKELF